MALSFQRRADIRSPRRIALFPGAWNPPTIAHLAIARAALGWANQVVWLLPRAFPHKSFEGATFEDRVEMLCRIAAADPAFSVAVAEGGLYAEMADEAREFFGPSTEIALLCGRDAAERIATWDYGRPGVFENMLVDYPLLVATRAGEYLPAARHADRVIALPLDCSFDEVSSTEVRGRIARGGEWRRLVPDLIVETVARAFPQPPLARSAKIVL